ncbi:MAG: radical SAM protein [Gammaproteobacteria bacterium]|nr:radical SAM protein [Gammaproteobacteria bacterium]
MRNELYLLAINITKRCNLACAHCYQDAESLKNGADGELTVDEVNSIIDEVASRGTQTMVVLTGGEPLARTDLEQMIAHGAQKGLAMVIGSNGALLTERRALSLKKAGALGIGISVDSLDEKRHDAFRGLPGSLQKTLTAIEHCRKHELSFQIHFTATKDNAHELNDIIAFGREKGARVLNIFFLICTGRGESISDISPQQYDELLHQIMDAQEQYDDIIIRPRCAPHFKRVAFERNPESLMNRISGYDGDGCIAGTHYCRITEKGAVTPCPYIANEIGNIREQSFLSIWDNADMLQQLRTPELRGACGECEYQKLCGGCRARPLAMGGTLMDADPWCSHVPQSSIVIQPYQMENTVGWTQEAEQRLSRIPGFLQGMIKKRAEAYVLEQGESRVTAEHLSLLAAKRFGGKIPKRPGYVE